MTYRGTVRSGVVVLPADIELAEGTEVVVVVPESEPAEAAVDVWAKLADLGRWAESQPCDLPADLALNHDRYLRGRPERE